MQLARFRARYNPLINSFRLSMDLRDLGIGLTR